MASWRDVERVCATLERARPGVAHEGSPTFDVARHPFARLRFEGGREILQVWTWELDSELALADRRDTFCHIATFSTKATLWAWLDRLEGAELEELLVESWRCRRGVRD